MNTEYLKKLSGGVGYIIISSTDAQNINSRTIIPRETTVIASLKVDGVEVINSGNADPYNFDSVNLLAGIDIITAPLGKKFDSIQLTSGSVGVFVEH